MNTFYIARHGETENNRDKRLSGWIDTPLTEDGLVPTETVIRKLVNVQIDALYSSDLGRAFITAYVIARRLGYEGEILRESGLREVNYGDAGNLPSAEAYAQYPGLDSGTHFVPPNGESLATMQQRVFDTLNRINEGHTDQNILLVCHSGVMAAIRASYIGQDFGAHNISEAYPHDYVGVFQIEDGVVKDFEEYDN